MAGIYANSFYGVVIGLAFGGLLALIIYITRLMEGWCKMVEKREPAPGWPILKGEYEVGDPKNCVLVTCGSHLPGSQSLTQGQP